MFKEKFSSYNEIPLKVYHKNTLLVFFILIQTDTAAVYRNEADIGRSLKELLPKYGLSRHDVFITSKLCEFLKGVRDY